MPTVLTESAIARALKDAKALKRRMDLADKGCPGLRLRVTPAGSRTWVLACRDRGGRMRRFRLGTYEQIGLSDARDAARSLHLRVKEEGADPTADKRAERVRAAEAREGIGTLAAVLNLYGAKVGVKRRSWSETRKRIDLVLKPLLDRPAPDLKLSELQLAVDSYASAKSAAFVVRSVRPVLKWASAPGRTYLPASLTSLAAPAEGAVQRRTRVLSRDELAALLPVLRATSNSYAAALRFMLLTLARRSEVAGTRWRDIDLAVATWTLSATKNGQPHVVPLSGQALDLLHARLPKDAAGNAIQPAPDAFVFGTSTGAPPGNWDRHAKSVQAASGTTGWTRHDLRRSGATMLGEMGTAPHVVEAALNHAAIHSALASNYNTARYRPEVAAALQRLADALDGIEVGAATVVPFRAAG